MRQVIIFFVFFMGLVLVLQAQDIPLSVSNQTCACASQKGDMLEEPQSFNFGKFKGECIDSCKFRPTKILDQKKARIKIGNIFHYGKYYKTELSPEMLSSLAVGFEEFTPNVFHVFLKFELNSKFPDLILKDQITGQKTTVKTRSLILSSEGIPPKDHEYSLLESYFGNYLLATRITSGEEMARWVKELKHPVKMYPLKVSAFHAGKIFLRGVEESHRLGINNIYQLFSNNCSTTALNFIDTELNFRLPRSQWEKFEDALPIAGPIGTLRSLINRKLIDEHAL